MPTQEARILHELPSFVVHTRSRKKHSPTSSMSFELVAFMLSNKSQRSYRGLRGLRCKGEKGYSCRGGRHERGLQHSRVHLLKENDIGMSFLWILTQP